MAKLEDLSRQYEDEAAKLQMRLRELRIDLKATEDSDEIWHLKRRIAELTPILTQMNELAELTKHYYDRGYYRSATYTCQHIRENTSLFEIDMEIEESAGETPIMISQPNLLDATKLKKNRRKSK